MKRTVFSLALVLGLFAESSIADSVSLAKLDWLAGRWVDDSGDKLSEETWTTPSGDGILGMWRLVVKGKIQLSEILTIQAEGDALVLRLRHFDSKLVGWEERDKPLELTLMLTGWNESEARFEGPGASGGGLAITYRHPDGATMTCTVERLGKKETFSFHRSP